MTTTANDHAGDVIESTSILPQTEPGHNVGTLSASEAQPVILMHRRRFEQLGFATLPVKPFSKEPVCEGWPERSPADQWREATDRYGAGLPINIGILAGGGRAFADSDDQATRENVRRFLEGLGVTPVEVDSASGGGRGHAYLAVANVPNGQHIYPFAREVGRGDLRVGRGAYVLTPPSATEKGRYRFQHGSQLESLAQQRVIDFRDLRPMLAAHSPATATAGADSLPVFIPKQPLSPWAVQLLERAAMIAAATPLGRVVGFEAGDPIFRTYASRSEIEMAVICHAITRGWQLADVHDLFETVQPGHYHDKGRNRRAYLDRTYRKALAFVASVPARARIAELYHAAESRAWPGRTGVTDFMVYRALLSAGYAAAKYEPNLSDREGAAAISSKPHTVGKAKKRLTAAGVITPLRREKVAHATAYRLNELDAGAAAPQRALDDLPGRAELWSPSKLGRSTGQVYRLLGHAPQTVRQLAKLTGRGRVTIWRALERLEREGLAQRRGAGWIIGTASAARVAREWQAPEDHAARLRDLERQQLGFRQWLITVQRQRENEADPRKRHGRGAGVFATKRLKRSA